MLFTEQDTLAKSSKDAFERAGHKLFEGSSVFFDLQRTLLAILKIQNNVTIYLVADVLDKYDSEFSEVLDLITDNGVTPLF